MNNNELRSSTLRAWAPFIVFTIVLFSLVTYRGLTSLQAEQDVAKTQALNLSALLSAEMSRSFEGVDQSLRWIADDIKMEAMLPGASKNYEGYAQQLLLKEVKRNPILQAMRIYDANGYRLYSSQPNETRINVADRAYFIYAKDHPEEIYHPTSTVINRYTNEPSLTYAKAIYSSSGNFLGVVIASVAVNELAAQFSKIDTGPNGAILLRSIGSGSLIYRYPTEVEQPNHELKNTPIQKMIAEGAKSGTVAFKSPVDGIYRLHGVSRLNQFPYIIAVGLAEKDYLQDWRIRIFFTYIGTFFLDALVGFFYFRQRRAFEILNTKLEELELSRANALDMSGRLELALNIKQIGVWDWDLVNDHKHWDDKMLQIYGISRENFAADHYGEWTRAVHPEDQAAAKSQLNAAIDGKSEYRIQYRIIHPIHGIRYIDAAAIVIKDQLGTPVKMIGVNVDITDDFLARESIELGKKHAEAALKLKTEFMNNMSHEIRTPMNGIIGLVTLALNQPLTPVLHNYLIGIESSANALLAIMNDILDFAKLEANKVVIAQAPFQLHDLLDAIKSLFEPAATAKNLDLFFLVDVDSKMQLIGDPFHIEQVLSNLVGNAIKFTEKGSVTLSISLLGMVNSKLQLRFSVKDTGIGISEESQKSLFESFTQVDGSLARRFGGTGLGLAISSRLLGLMGSQLILISAEGSGSNFYFDLAVDSVARSQN